MSLSTLIDPRSRVARGLRTPPVGRYRCPRTRTDALPPPSLAFHPQSDAVRPDASGIPLGSGRGIRRIGPDRRPLTPGVLLEGQRGRGRAEGAGGILSVLSALAQAEPFPRQGETRRLLVHERRPEPGRHLRRQTRAGSVPR